MKIGCGTKINELEHRIGRGVKHKRRLLDSARVVTQMQIGKLFYFYLRSSETFVSLLLVYPWLSIVWGLLLPFTIDLTFCHMQLPVLLRLFARNQNSQRDFFFLFLDERLSTFSLLRWNFFFFFCLFPVREKRHITHFTASHTLESLKRHDSSFNFGENFSGMKNVSKINEQENNFCLNSHLNTEKLWISANFSSESLNLEQHDPKMANFGDWLNKINESFQFEMEESVHNFFFAKIANFMAVFVGKWKLTERQLRKLKFQARQRCSVGVGRKIEREQISTCARVGAKGKWKSHVVENSRLFQRRRKVDFVDSMRDIVAA